MTNRTEESVISLTSLLERLKLWRHLPAYQLERRVDALFSLVLPEIVNKEFKLGQSKVLEVIPEFPLHKGLILSDAADNNKTDNRSRKVDFAVFAAEPKQIFLVELKTDNNSINCEQLKDMEAAQAETLLKGVLECAIHSDSPRKYAHLIWVLSGVGCIKNCHTLKRVNLDKKGCHLKDKFKNLEICKAWSKAQVKYGLVYPGCNPRSNMSESIVEEIESWDWLTSIRFSKLIEQFKDHPFASFLQELTEFEAGRDTPWKN